MATAIYDAEQHGDMDIIFAGGGTAACVAAGRLAKANPDLKILLVEGGKNNYEDPTVRNPALYLTHLAPDSKTALVSILLFLPRRSLFVIGEEKGRYKFQLSKL